MTSLKATLELNVPAVLGGARSRRCDPYFKLRPSSVRGGLRYWFRAAVASQLWPHQGKNPQDEQRQDNAMLETLRELEARVFGNTDRHSTIAVLPPEGGIIETWRPVPTSKDQPGLAYLGYGLFGKHPTDRLSTPHGQPIQLEFLLRGETPEHRAAVAAALWLWTAFGGLGARSRRGYGSMRLVSLVGEDGDIRFSTLCGLQNSHQDHLNQLQRGVGLCQVAVEQLVRRLGLGEDLLDNTAKRPHPHVRSLAGIVSLHALHSIHDDPLDALDYAGRLFQSYRSSLLRRTPLRDYHTVKAALQTPFPPPPTVDRADFGLPLNFYYRSLNGAKAQFLPQTPDGQPKSDRLASPLLFRVHALAVGADKRRYGVTLTNLAGHNTSPLQGCTILGKGQGKDMRGTIEPSSLRLIDGFIDWAVAESKRAPSPATPRRQSGKRRRS